MNRLKMSSMLLTGLLALTLNAQAVFAAPAVKPKLEPVSPDKAGIEFKVAYENGAYAVYMRPNVTPEGLNLTLTSQVTIKAPHADGDARFEVSNLQSAVDGADWAQSSRVDAPSEDGSADYISFTVNFTDGNHRAYQWVAGQEIKLFTFTNGGACLGAVSLLDNGDTFARSGNSANTNPGNQIDVLGIDRNNAYVGNYGEAASCSSDGNTPRQEEEAAKKLYMPLAVRP
ncbi:MAG: cadherin [Caldilinea sp. CFX5]|nr:cadherin [Caldilinea sp. CFX5]